MSLLDAARRAVRHFPGGAGCHGRAPAKAAGTLEARAARRPARLQLGAVMPSKSRCWPSRAGTRLAYANSVADALGAVLVLLPRDGSVRWHRRRTCGALDERVRRGGHGRGRRRGRQAFTRRELEDLERQWADVVGAGQVLLRNMRARHDADVLSRRAAVEAAR